MTTKRRLTRIAPLKAGIVLGIFYGIAGLIAAPLLLLAAFAGREGVGGGIALAVMIPIIYAVGGFVGGIIAAALYNLVVKWTGGLEFEVSDVTTVA
jgi:hypothetical protein